MKLGCPKIHKLGEHLKKYVKSNDDIIEFSEKKLRNSPRKVKKNNRIKRQNSRRIRSNNLAEGVPLKDQEALSVEGRRGLLHAQPKKKTKS